MDVRVERKTGVLLPRGAGNGNDALFPPRASELTVAQRVNSASQWCEIGTKTTECVERYEEAPCLPAAHNLLGPPTFENRLHFGQWRREHPCEFLPRASGSPFHRPRWHVRSVARLTHGRCCPSPPVGLVVLEGSGGCATAGDNAAFRRAVDEAARRCSTAAISAGYEAHCRLGNVNSSIPAAPTVSRNRRLSA